MSIPPLNSSTPSVQFQPVAQSPTTGNVNTSTEKRTVINNSGAANIVRSIQSEIESRGPGAKVEYCRGAVERTEPDNPNAPAKIETYFNKELNQHCYKMKMIWVVKIVDSKGTEEILEIHQERITTLATPPVKYPRLESNRAYRAFLLGSEYANTISAVFDPNAPGHAKMQNELNRLLADDRLTIKIRPSFIDNVFHNTIGSSDDPAILFKGFRIAEVSWKDKHSGKKVKILDRNYKKEVYETDQQALHNIPAKPGVKSDNKEILKQYDILKAIKVDIKNCERFTELTKLEALKKDSILNELKKANIDESEWMERLVIRAEQQFGSSINPLGGKDISIKKLNQLVTQFETLKNNPSRTPQEEQIFKQLRDNVKGLRDALTRFDAKTIDQVDSIKQQLEALSEAHSVRGFFKSGARKKINYVEGLIALNNRIHTIGI